MRVRYHKILMKVLFAFAALLILFPVSSRGDGKNRERKDADITAGTGTGIPPGLTVSRGDFADRITVKWNRGECRGPCEVYRSTFPDGPYEEVGVMKRGTFNDTAAAPGIKYWYRLLVAQEGAPVLLYEAVPGFRKSKPVKGENLDQVIRNKNRTRVAPGNREQKARENIHIDLLKKYYMNRIKLNLVIYTGASYIRKGDLLLIRNFDDYVIDYRKRELFLVKKGSYTVKFFSGRLFRIFEELGKSGGGADGVRRLIENAMAYCIYSGDMESPTPDGMTAVLPLYEALGLSTEYFRDNAEWKSSTIMVGSGNKKLMKMMREAQSGRSDEQAEK